VNNRIPAEPKKPRVPYSNDHESITLSVQCTEESHADRPWLIASFYVDFDAPGGPMWLSSTNYWRNDEHVAKIQDDARRTLVGDEVVTAERHKSEPDIYDNGSRRRYSFQCKICGLSIARKAAVVEPVFNRLAGAGVSEISLSALAAILR